MYQQRAPKLSQRGWVSARQTRAPGRQRRTARTRTPTLKSIAGEVGVRSCRCVCRKLSANQPEGVIASIRESRGKISAINPNTQVDHVKAVMGEETNASAKVDIEYEHDASVQHLERGVKGGDRGLSRGWRFARIV